MSSLRVIEVLDVVRNGDREFDVGDPALAVEQFDLHRAPEGFHWRVVVAVADRAHGAEQSVATDVLGEGPRGELAAVVAIKPNST